MITTAKRCGDGLTINGGGKWLANSHQTVQDWLAGRDDEWLELELTFVAETHAHANWTSITTYDARLVQYEANLAAYDAWSIESEEPQPDEPIPLVKPKGYYTVEESSDSIAEHQIWLTAAAAYEAENEEPYPVPEVEMLPRPYDLVEPTITPLPDPVPNTPEPEFTQEQLDEQVIANDLAALQATDSKMARVAEDLYEFIVNGVAIPQEAKDIIADRKVKRDKIKI